MNSPLASRPELCAPAGTTESFFAAMEAGADAIYCGPPSHNARLRADNFSLSTLGGLIGHAHRHGIRIYATLNTLVLQREMREIITLIHDLSRLGVDALIVQDLGVVHLVRAYVPSMKLHASTQMGLHNRAGVQQAHAMGISRVIPARELTLEEITTLTRETGMEIEVFVHGALCFANAGMCLASSYCGGMSANRGRCLQACRRRYTAGKDTGFFFSMKDLCTCDYSTRLTDAGIHSVKIEGRMKNAEYVYTVVRAYRRLLDDPAAASEEKQLLIHDGGRAKTPLFLGGSFSPQVLQPSRPGATGTRVGRIDQATGRTCTISRPRVIPAPGDRIRIQPSGGHGGTNATVERCSRQASRIRLTFKNLSGQIRPGDTAYRTSEYHARRARTHAVIHELPRIRLTRDRRGIEQALRQYAPARSGTQDRRSRTGRILVKVDSLKWLSMLNQKHIHGCILALERTGVDRLVRNRKLLRAWKKTMGVRIPPVLYEDEYARWHRTVAACKNRGIDTFYISNLSHVALVGTDARCYWDGAVSGGMNRAALEELRQLGCTGRIVSLEDDVENMAACSAHPPVLAETIACVYGYVPVYLSRVPLPLKPGTTLKDPKGISFFTAERNGLTCVLGSKPLCLFASRDRLEHAGITTHCIDVSHIPPAARTLQTLLRAYHERQCPRGTHTFNVHHGIR